jgi:hypothetical protein
MVAVQYLLEEHYIWFALTTTWIACPFLIVQVFSMRWLVADGKLLDWKSWLVNCLYFQPLERWERHGSYDMLIYSLPHFQVHQHIQNSNESHEFQR